MRKHSRVMILGAYDPERRPSHRSDDRPVMPGERLSTSHGVHDWFDALEEFAKEHDLRPGCRFRMTLELDWEPECEDEEVEEDGELDE